MYSPAIIVWVKALVCVSEARQTADIRLTSIHLCGIGQLMLHCLILEENQHTEVFGFWFAALFAHCDLLILPYQRGAGLTAYVEYKCRK